MLVTHGAAHQMLLSRQATNTENPINWADVDDLAPEWDRVESGIGRSHKHLGQRNNSSFKLDTQHKKAWVLNNVAMMAAT